MAVVDMVMPQMGESVMEGTILQWFKNVGDVIEEDESIAEVATDKVDTEIPSMFSGTIVEIVIPEGEIAQVGSPICKIDVSGEASVAAPVQEEKHIEEEKAPEPEEAEKPVITIPSSEILLDEPITGRFYSPLVSNIAKKEKIDFATLERIKGTGKEGRVTKKDILVYIDFTKNQPEPITEVKTSIQEEKSAPAPVAKAESKPKANSKVEIKEPAPVSKTPAPSISGEYEIQEMDRMRQIIADRMLDSKKTSAHVTSFVEADVTNIVYWKNKHKNHFHDKEGVTLTLTPIFTEAVAKALKDFPKLNASVYENKLYIKKDINIGMAVALPTGNLIVPVIKNADQLNIVGLTKKVNDLAKRAKHNTLKPQDVDGGTFTISNMGSFGNIMGTPIIVQPQIGILALGAVVKKPTVIETPYGDTIGIRHKMILSHSYDHRVVDGALGGMFVRRVADYLERFDIEREL